MADQLRQSWEKRRNKKDWRKTYVLTAGRGKRKGRILRCGQEPSPGTEFACVMNCGEEPTLKWTKTQGQSMTLGPFRPVSWPWTTGLGRMANFHCLIGTTWPNWVINKNYLPWSEPSTKIIPAC
jgi:hypothetical protein